MGHHHIIMPYQDQDVLKIYFHSLTVVVRFRSPVRRSGTRCLTSSEIRRVVLTVLSSFLRQFCLVFTNVTSALEVFKCYAVRYINPGSTYSLLTKGIKKSCAHKNRLYKRCIKTNRNSDGSKYKAYKKILKHVIDKAKEMSNFIRHWQK